MPLPIWPSGLEHRPVADSGGVDSPYPEAIVTEFEDGPPRQRRQSYTGVRKLPYMVRLRSRAEVAQFDAFVTDSLGEGTGHFRMQVMLPGVGCVDRRCYIDGGRWTSRPNGGGGHTVSFTLCVFPS
ncbi:hypothetical protein [Camelimonas lactis]|uniref:Uncharacterized protein n=1 Tax=Camelimonas lactis TaxID=659006 RepID=A0A4R2GZ29_9HYPH|nr:hypothetical protein [Camelimonas lactis]TCO15876.1 hypothetical protein EV666_101125 [Camelimonas lactis]